MWTPSLRRTTSCCAAPGERFHDHVKIQRYPYNPIPAILMTTPARGNVLVGIGFMLLSVMLFSLSGAIGKWLVAAYPMGEALLIRSLVALVLLAPFLWRAGLS